MSEVRKRDRLVSGRGMRGKGRNVQGGRESKGESGRISERPEKNSCGREEEQVCVRGRGGRGKTERETQANRAETVWKAFDRKNGQYVSK